MDKTSSVLIPTLYLPPIEFFIRLMKIEILIIENEENYIKQTYRSRCEIYSANGRLSLTIPVIKTHGNHTRIKDIKIDYRQKWQINHWRAIVSAYNHSPYFPFYRDQFEKLYSNKFNYLVDFNLQLFQLILKLLKLNISITITKEYIHKASIGCMDLRYSINPKNPTPIKFTQYIQVFRDKYGFQPNLSIIDLLFNNGPEAMEYLLSHANKNL